MAALLRSQQASVWAAILAPAAEANAAGVLWQNLRALPAPGATSWLGKISQQRPKQPSAAKSCQKDTAANKQQRATPLRQATEQPGQTAASQGGPGQKPVKQKVLQDTLWKELRTLLFRPFHRIMARTAMSWIPALIEEEFDASQFLEGCKGAFVAVQESMLSTRDLATMVSLPMLNAYASVIEARKDKRYRLCIRPGSVNPGQPSIVSWGIIPRKLWARQNMNLARKGHSLLPMPGIAADDEYQDCPEEVDAKEAQESYLTDLKTIVNMESLMCGSSLVVHVRFSGCSFVLETRDRLTGDLIQETVDQRCSTWSFGRGPLPDQTYPVRDFGADLPWVVYLIN